MNALKIIRFFSNSTISESKKLQITEITEITNLIDFTLAQRCLIESRNLIFRLRRALDFC